MSQVWDLFMFETLSVYVLKRYEFVSYFEWVLKDVIDIHCNASFVLVVMCF